MQDLGGGKGAFLLSTWHRGAMDLRANGFQPASEAQGDHRLRLKDLADRLPKLVSEAKIVGMLGKGEGEGAVGSDATAQRLSRTRLAAALSAGQGSALALVSEWPDHVSIDACVVNPGYLIAGENAEAVLLNNVAKQALEKGITSIRLPQPTFQVSRLRHGKLLASHALPSLLPTRSYDSSLQVEGDLFYARCGFFPEEEGSEAAEADNRVLYYRPTP